MAIGAWFLIVDFPDRAAKKGLLKEDEANFIAQRIERDRGDATPDPLTWSKFCTHLKDFKLWAFALMFMSTAMPAYALAYFGPVIVNGMGYSVGITHLLGAPPVVFAVIVCANLYFSDVTANRHHRSVFSFHGCLTNIR